MAKIIKKTDMPTAKRSHKKKVSPTVKKPDVKVERVQAKHLFTVEEKEEIFRKGGRANSEIFSLESQISSIKKDYAAKIETQENIRNDCYRKIDDGYEMRETDAVIVFNNPKDNRKTSFRYDATKDDGRGELIEETDMTAADKEMDLFARQPKQEPQPGVNAPKPEEKETAMPYTEDEIERAKNRIWASGKEKVSTVFIQRHLGITYNAASKIAERLAEMGVLGSVANSEGEREVLEQPDNPVIPPSLKVPTVEQTKDFLNEQE